MALTPVTRRGLGPLDVHASLFTGRWPHELDVNWRTRLGTQFPTLAEYLGSRG
jgi:hypothetical protein